MLLSVILAHAIRHQFTRQYQAVTSLSSSLRWCLTGTPIQNSIEDIHALLRFLEIPPLNERAAWKKFIVYPLRSGDRSGLETLRRLFDCLCLRRTRDILVLPHLSRQLCPLDLSEEDSVAYSRIKSGVKEEIDTAVSRSGRSRTMSTVLRGILRLRSLCNHGTWTPGSSQPSPSEPNAEEAFAFSQFLGETKCAKCSCQVDSLEEGEGLTSGLMIGCSHLICRDCLGKHTGLKKDGTLTCPFCPEVVSFPSTPSTDADGPEIITPSSPMLEDTEDSANCGSTKLNFLVKDILARQNDGKW